QPGGDLLGSFGRVLPLRLGDQVVLPIDAEPNRGLAPGRQNRDTTPALVAALHREKRVMYIADEIQQELHSHQPLWVRGTGLAQLHCELLDLVDDAAVLRPVARWH